MKKTVTFKNRQIDVAADLYLPEDFNPEARYASIVVAHPGSSCKEQTAGIYAAKLARKGFVTLAVNASYQGESGGEPRNIEDPAARMEDLRCAIDYLVTLPYVDEERIGALGICAGGGYVVCVSMTERRIKAVGTAAGANIGAIYRGNDPAATIRMLEAIGRQRTAEARGAEPMIVPWVAAEQKDAPDVDVREAYEYYCTPRGQHRSSTNELRYTSLAYVMAFDPLNMVEKYLTQPLEIIVGEQKGAFGSYDTGHELYARGASEQKDLYVIPGATHYDLYDDPQTTDKAVERLAQFYRKYL